MNNKGIDLQNLAREISLLIFNASNKLKINIKNYVSISEKDLFSILKFITKNESNNESAREACEIRLYKITPMISEERKALVELGLDSNSEMYWNTVNPNVKFLSSTILCNYGVYIGIDRGYMSFLMFDPKINKIIDNALQGPKSNWKGEIENTLVEDNIINKDVKDFSIRVAENINTYAKINNIEFSINKILTLEEVKIIIQAHVNATKIMNDNFPTKIDLNNEEYEEIIKLAKSKKGLSIYNLVFLIVASQIDGFIEYKGLLDLSTDSLKASVKEGITSFFKQIESDEDYISSNDILSEMKKSGTVKYMMGDKEITPYKFEFDTNEDGNNVYGKKNKYGIGFWIGVFIILILILLFSK